MIGLYVQLDVNWPDNPKMIRAGLEGMGVHAMACCLVKPGSDGWFPITELTRRGVPVEVIARLAALDLLFLDGDSVRPWFGDLVRLPSKSRPHIPAAIRRAVYDRDGHRCLQCGATESLSLDHIWPFSLFGPDTIENLQTLCKPCNSRKGAKT